MGSVLLPANKPVTASTADAKRPLPFEREPAFLFEPDPDVFLASEAFAEDVLLAEADDFDLEVPPFAALLEPPPLDDAEREDPDLDPPAVEVRDDPDLDPPADLDAADLELPEDLDVPDRDDPGDLAAVVFFAPDLADEELFAVDGELFADLDEAVPEFDRDPAEDFVPRDFEFDDFDPPDLGLLDLDEVDFEVEDFLVVGIFVSSVFLNLKYDSFWY